MPPDPSASSSDKAAPDSFHVASRFAENLKARILSMARIRPSDLPSPSGREILDARVATLIIERDSSQKSLKKIADSLMRQFPNAVRSVQRTTPSPVEEIAPGSSQANAATAMLQQPVLPRTHQQRAATTDVSHPSDARPEGYFLQPTRLEAVRKRELAKADREFLEAMQRETASYAAEEQRRKEERARVRETMRRDMAVEAKLREERMAKERIERQRLREQVCRESDDVKAAEELDRERRRRKLEKEKEAISQQREARRQAEERAKARKLREDLMYRRQIDQGIQEDTELTKKRSVETRKVLLSYLEESKSILRAKREQARQERANLARQAQVASPFIVAGAGDAGSNPLPESVKLRCRLQDRVSKSYAYIAEEEAAKCARLEAAALEAESRTAEEQARRNAEDVAKAQRMRAALVASLDLELRIQQERKQKQKLEKLEQRKAVDALTMSERTAAEKTIEQAKERQRELRRELAMQTMDRQERSMSPQSMKLYERPAHFLSKTPPA